MSVMHCKEDEHFVDKISIKIYLSLLKLNSCLPNVPLTENTTLTW